MKTFLLSFLGIIILALIIYAIPTTRQEVIRLLSYSECDTPLPYTLGSIDQRFGLSQDEARSDIKTATDLWSSANGKQLFTYSNKAELTVNFIYDQRQALDSEINQLHTQLKQNVADLDQQIADYKTQSASFQQRLNSFNATVDKYNQEGGAPPDVYADLNNQQKQLKTEADALNARAKQLNLATHDYNTGISTLNQDISQFNNALAKKPEEGLYDGNNHTITLYFASNRQELLHTLTHEFGHSLGMEHVSNPTAIMYPFTTSSLNLTSDDLQQLAYVCREQSAIAHWGYTFDLWLITHIQSFRQQIPTLSN